MGQAGLEGVWGLWSLRIHCGNATREREPSRSKIKGHCEASEDTAGKAELCHAGRLLPGRALAHVSSGTLLPRSRRESALNKD